MSCEWCGSSRHSSENCHTRELSRALTGKKYDPEKIADYVSIMPVEGFIELTEKELHDQVVNLKKITQVKHKKR